MLLLLPLLLGYVCTRSQLDKVKAGCCNETDASLPRIKQFTCDQCDTNPPHCCDVFEHCVSCCMHPLNVRFVLLRWPLGQLHLQAAHSFVAHLV